MICSKDSDFRQRSLLLGAPPKVIWLRLGNCRTDDIERVLRHGCMEVLAFDSDVEATLLTPLAAM